MPVATPAREGTLLGHDKILILNKFYDSLGITGSKCIEKCNADNL